MLLFELTKEELMKLDKELLARIVIAQNGFLASTHQVMQDGLSNTADALMALTDGLVRSREPFVETYGALLEEINEKVSASAGALN